MGTLRRHRFLISFLVVLVFCSVMVLRQMQRNQARHVEMREAFILLYTKGYKDEAGKLYTRLCRDVEKLPNRVLLEDFHRTLLLVDPLTQQKENLIWNYHWYVSNVLEDRSESTLKRALKMAEEE